MKVKKVDPQREMRAGDEAAGDMLNNELAHGKARVMRGEFVMGVRALGRVDHCADRGDL